MNYNVEIDWSDVIKVTQRLSSYEGRAAVSATGESDYPYVHLTDQDAPLLLTYIAQGILAVESGIDTLLSEVEMDDDYIDGGTSYSSKATFKFVIDGARVSRGTLKQMLSEAIASYVMSQWLSDKSEKRMEFYTNLFNQMITSIQKSLSRKVKPSLDINYTIQ